MPLITGNNRINMKKIVVLTDPHLGQNGKDGDGQFSLLSYQVKDNLIDKLESELDSFSAGDPISLVVTGDLLDLSLAFIHDGLDDLTHLLAQLTSVKELVIVVGNHDQHLWSMHSEEQRVCSMLRQGSLPQQGGVYLPTAVTGESFGLLTKVMSGVDVKIAYPTYELIVAGGKQILVFTHGHLMGGLYTIVSDLLGDQLFAYSYKQVAATANLPIIELIYWLLGEICEGFGANGLVEVIFTDLQKGKDGRLRPIVERAVAKAFSDGLVWGLPDNWERGKVVDFVMEKIAGYIGEGSPLTSSDRHADASETRRMVVDWVKKTKLHERHPPVTHLFSGHTHDADMFNVQSTKIIAINLGSWLVEPGRDTPDTQIFEIEDDPESGKVIMNPVVIG